MPEVLHLSVRVQLPASSPFLSVSLWEVVEGALHMMSVHKEAAGAITDFLSPSCLLGGILSALPKIISDFTDEMLKT